MLRVNLQLVRQIDLSNAKQRLAVFYRLPVLDENLRNCSVIVAFDFVHQLHGFYDCEVWPFFTVSPTDTNGSASSDGAA